MKKQWLLWMMTLVVLLVIAPTVQATERDINYTALGDSLAEGMNEQGKIGKGYADFIAAFLQQEGTLNAFTKEFAHSGYTSSQVLADLVQDVTGTKQSITTTLGQSQMVTLSVGANDLFETLRHLQVDMSKGIPNEALPQVMQTIQQMTINIKAIVQEIERINPDAQIYVMGYYNPFPYVESIKPQIEPMIEQMDVVVQQALQGTSAVFVPVNEQIASNYPNYLPNPENVHLSEAGYELVAQHMLEAMTNNNQRFNDIASHWAKPYIEQAATLGLIKGYDDGTYRPNKGLTRAQTAIILARALQVKATSTAPFTDIQQLAPETQHMIHAVYGAGIVQGKEGKFRPNDNVTRSQFALMIHRSYTALTGNVYKAQQPAPFTDLTNTSQEVKEAVAMLAELGIAEGNNNQYQPSATVTRAHAAKMITKAVNILMQHNTNEQLK